MEKEAQRPQYRRNFLHAVSCQSLHFSTLVSSCKEISCQHNIGQQRKNLSPLQVDSQTHY